MLGFGKKQSTQPPETEAGEKQEKDEIRIHTIPEVFYGGQFTAPPPKPAVAPKKPVAAVPKPAQKKPLQKVSKHAQDAAQKKKKLMLGGGVLVLLLFVAGATWFYTRDSGPVGPVGPDIDIPVEVVIDQPTEIPEEVPEEQTPTTTPTLLLPVLALSNTIDFDGDGLTDVEEELYGTDISNPDTDKDNFPDGIEIVNLYDPIVFAPASIVTSTAIDMYINKQHDWSVIHPVDWLASPLDSTNEDEVFLTSITGEYISITSYTLENNESFLAWFSKNNPEVVYSSLVSWKNRMGQSGWYEPHQLRYYFARPDAVYVIQYNAGVRSAVNFRQSGRMIAESFHFPKKSTGQPTPGIQESVTSTPDTSQTTSTPTEDTGESSSLIIP